MSATPLHIDNQSAIKVGKNPEHHSQMKHLNMKYHWLQEQVEDNSFTLDYVPTDKMPADVPWTVWCMKGCVTCLDCDGMSSSEVGVLKVRTKTLRYNKGT